MAETAQRTDIDFEEFRKLLEDERARLTDLHHRQRADMEEEARDVSENELSTADCNEPADIGSRSVPTVTGTRRRTWKCGRKLTR